MFLRLARIITLTVEAYATGEGGCSGAKRLLGCGGKDTQTYDGGGVRNGGEGEGVTCGPKRFWRTGVPQQTEEVPKK